MDFTTTEAQRDLAALTRQILASRLTPDRLRELDANDEPFDRALWADLAGAGVLAAALPKRAGGDDYGLLEQCSVLAELGRAVAPVPYLASIVTAASAIAEFGDDAQVQRWAVPAGRGELVLTAALAEGTVQASRSAGTWSLSGSVPVVPAAPYADAILVPAADGAAVFLVTPGDEGVSVEPQRVAGGEGAGWLDLSGVSLDHDRRLGGGEVTGWLRARETIGLCAAQLGVAERALELTAEYARARVQFGRAIGEFQAVAQRLADAYIDVEGIRLTLWQAAWLLSEGRPAATEVSTAKFWAADAGHRVAHTAVHVHGGVGIDLDHPLHRYFLAAKHHEFTLGGATAQLLCIGAALALPDTAPEVR
ncbi:MAG: 3-oxocholest-4-en-26-oyl-CoA dehydrogenase beta subunit [Cryptosporangiaceae bacterium]|nr:3-oxocholest-4-en-26-oyl-CoA dehydrogenase beta subunit [Cryptosporangiaceae bacterium]